MGAMSQLAADLDYRITPEYEKSGADPDMYTFGRPSFDTYSLHEESAFIVQIHFASGSVSTRYPATVEGFRQAINDNQWMVENYDETGLVEEISFSFLKAVYPNPEQAADWI